MARQLAEGWGQHRWDRFSFEYLQSLVQQFTPGPRPSTDHCRTLRGEGACLEANGCQGFLHGPASALRGSPLQGLHDTGASAGRAQREEYAANSPQASAAAEPRRATGMVKRRANWSEPGAAGAGDSAASAAIHSLAMVIVAVTVVAMAMATAMTMAIGRDALACLILGEEKSSPPRPHPLPRALYGDAIASFLHFDEPVPNQLYVIGGRNREEGPLDTVEMFDTWYGCWVQCPSMSARRAGCAAAVLPDERILCVGGYDANGIVKGLLASCE
ncbi:unnamed protein product, partial [Prorocentrum cordatum]